MPFPRKGEKAEEMMCDQGNGRSLRTSCITSHQGSIQCTEHIGGLAKEGNLLQAFKVHFHLCNGCHQQSISWKGTKLLLSRCNGRISLFTGGLKVMDSYIGSSCLSCCFPQHLCTPDGGFHFNRS